jgi:hypothetical protein
MEFMKELYTALISAQAEFKTAIKDVSNTFFKSKYADLESIVAAVQPALTKHGLGFIQPVTTLSDGRMIITTTIIHISGQSIDSIYPVDPVKKDPQGYGSAITYGRRYALSSMLGVVTGDDDDGNEASGKNVIGKLEGEIKTLQDLVSNIKNQNLKKDAEIKDLKHKLSMSTASVDTQKVDALFEIVEDPKPAPIVNHAPQAAWETFKIKSGQYEDLGFKDINFIDLQTYFAKLNFCYKKDSPMLVELYDNYNDFLRANGHSVNNPRSQQLEHEAKLKY